MMAPARMARRLLPRPVKAALRWTLGGLIAGRRDSRPSDMDEFVQKAMEEYVRSNPGDQQGRESISFDKLRFVRSLDWLSMTGLRNKQVLELGGYGIASHIIGRFFPHNEYVVTDFDLRSQFPYPNNRFDVLVSMEVIEHICDIDYQHATTLSGARHCLEESLRVLKPGGKMFLTTPNAASSWVIQRALLHQPPMLYEYHFREFTIGEIRSLVEEAGFQLIEAKTEKVWHFWDFDPITDFMRLNGYSLDDRGDDTFLLAEKPS